MRENRGVSSRRPRRIFLAFLAASAAAHAAILAGVSLRPPDAARGLSASMEVSILPPEPLPAVPVEQAPQRGSKAHRARAAEPALQASARAQPEPVSTLPEPAAAVSSLQAPVADEPPASQPVEKPGEAVAVATSPGVRAAYLRNPAPRYPDSARRAGEQGTVTLRVLVTREGLPARVAVEKSSGSRRLDRAALEAVKAWRFAPAVRDGQRVDSWMLVPVVFRLEGAS